LLKKGRRYLLKNGFLITPERAESFILNKNFKLIIFIREPMARIASAFINKFIIRSGKPLRYPKGFEIFAKKFIADLYEHDGYLGDYKGLSFIEFLNYIGFSIKNQLKLNSHWSLQSSGLTNELKEIILSKNCFIVKQESFDYDLKKVNLAFGLNYLPEKRNASHWSENWRDLPKNKDCSELTNQKIVRRIIITKDNLLLDSTKADIARIYHADFELFSYLSKETPKV
jgi:hypothetical protein